MDKLKLKLSFLIGVTYIIISTAVVSHSINTYHNDNVKPVQNPTKPETTQVAVTQPTSETTQPTTQTQIRTVKLDCYSVQNDLKIKFIDSQTKQYITGIQFNVTVTGPDGKQTNYTNKDLKGYIYVSKLKSGNYTIKLNDVPEGFVKGNDTVTVKVKDKVEKKVITDIKDNLVVDKGGKEDTKVNEDIVQEVVLKDTVEFVQTTKTKIPGETRYIVVGFSDVRLPEGTTQPTSQQPTVSNLALESTTSESTTKEPSSTSPDEQLYDNQGNKLYIKVSEKYVLATTKDYKSTNEFFKQEIIPDTYKYTGWQTIDGKTYYYDKNGYYVTGNQVINGAKYSFDGNGVLKPGYGVLGIDVSKYQGTIDWKKVKASGVQFVIIRAGYRGYGTGKLVEDVNFKANIKGATAAGLDVGIYFFSQAIDEREAVEEASLSVELVKGYKIKYPIFIDTETSGGNGSGRADGLTVQQRTAVCKAFCETIQSAGYKAGIYTSKSWFEKKLDMSQLGQFRVWLAQWTDKPTYSGKFDVWQYTSKGQVDGIKGNVDMNLSYMTF